MLCVFSSAAGCDEIMCGREHTIAALRHLPPRNFFGVCDSFVCEPEQEAGMHQWAKEIRAVADKQTDHCVASAYRTWAWYYDYTADENAARWRTELAARAIEEKLK
jgi:hypothetical protein